jgi:hypothetical protein
MLSSPGKGIIDNYKLEVKLLADLFKYDLPSFYHGQKERTNAFLRKQVSNLEQILGIERDIIEIIEKELKEYIKEGREILTIYMQHIN